MIALSMVVVSVAGFWFAFPVSPSAVWRWMRGWCAYPTLPAGHPDHKIELTAGELAEWVALTTPAHLARDGVNP